VSIRDDGLSGATLRAYRDWRRELSMTTRGTTRITNGLLLLGIGVIHNLVGIAAGIGLPAASPGGMAGRKLFSEILSGGIVGAIEPDPWRTILFWFLFFGFAMMILGWFMHLIERSGHPIPRTIAWHTGALALAGGLLIPASGFWLVLPVAWRMGRRRS
jgi:hypothetical protein